MAWMINNSMQTADNAKAQLLLEDRRRLLEHVIHVRSAAAAAVRALSRPLARCRPGADAYPVSLARPPRAQVFQSHGGRLQLPIGMTVAEPWLLDSVDVAALLRALSAAGASKPEAPIELLSFCQRGAR